MEGVGGKGVGQFRKAFNMITAGEDEHGLTGDAQRRIGEEKGAGVGKY